MNIEIKNEIIEVLRPVTDGDADLKRTVNILILNGIEKSHRRRFYRCRYGNCREVAKRTCYRKYDTRFTGRFKR